MRDAASVTSTAARVRPASAPTTTRSLCATTAPVRTGGSQDPERRALTSRNASVERRRRKARGTIGQRRIGQTGDGDPPHPRQNVRMRSGFLSERQRRLAWLGFVLAAFQAPLAAKLIDDASWLFAVVVAAVVATVILADDAQRRRPETVE